MSRIGDGLVDITWGVPPPPMGINESTGRLRPSEVAAVALARPGVWGCYDVGSPYAGRYAHRLRQYGVEATSRGTLVYFRAAQA